MRDCKSIQLPTKPYLKKYLQALYGSPVVFTRESNFGMAALGFLGKKLYFRQKKELVHKAFDKFDTQLDIVIPSWWKHQSKFGKDFSVQNIGSLKDAEISVQNIVSLNKLFEEQMENQLTYFCLTSKMEIKKSLYRFCDIHSIEVGDNNDGGDITYEALKQKEYRARKCFPQAYLNAFTRFKAEC